MELTLNDKKQIEEEIEHRKVVVRHELLEEVKRTRAFGDLSENFEYKEAKRAKNKNESRIRYLERVLKFATIVEDLSAPDTIGLFDTVEYQVDDEEETERIQIVTKMKTDGLAGMITKDSPLGKAIFGHKIGDICEVVAPACTYNVTIKNIIKGNDDGSIPIRSY
jgi:transcription elongation factor GreA